MFCEKCGTQLAEGTRFCTKCGNPIMQNTPTWETKETFETQQSFEQPKKKLLIGIVIGMAVIASALIVAIVAMLLLSRNNETDVTQKTVKHQRNQEEDMEEVMEEETTEVESSEQQEEISQNEMSTVQETVEEQDANVYSAYRTLTVDEQALSDKIFQINSSNYATPIIDVYADKYVPGTRDYNAVWDSRVFYQVEGFTQQTEYFSKNNCTLAKRQLWTAASRNRMDYEIYKNPTTGRPNKIISLEYLSDGMEITEYYYTNEGTISFIFQYYTDNYVSSYATPSMPGSRFLFDHDSLITWRVIEFDSTTNYVLGTAEAERMKRQFSANTIKYYNDLPDDKRRAFNEMERKMINAAYNTYHTVMNAEGVALIQGYVNDAAGSGIAEADVKLFTEDFEVPLFTGTTDNNGKYYIYVPSEEYNYNLKISKDGFYDSEIYGVTMRNEQVEASQDSVYLFTPDMENADVELKLGDALNYSADGTSMEPLEYADIYVRNGMNNRIGQITYQTQSDSNGNVNLNLSPGMYTVEVASSGFENMYYNIQSNPIKSQNFYEFYATPDLGEGELRIVLTWGATPSDLDSHLFSTVGSNSDHIWYGDRIDAFGSNLDVDDTSSYGPETITIPDFSNENYYKYCVTDYTNCSAGNCNSLDMSYSDACVNVYSSNGLVATFHVPAVREGVIWEVFEIRKGDITPIQRYYNNVTDKSWWSHE